MMINSVNTSTNVTPLKNMKPANQFCTKNELTGDSISFTSQKHKAPEQKKKSSVIHKALVAATGAFIPGLGQALNGQWGKALLFAVGAPVAVFASMTVSLPLALAVGTAAEIGMYIDAYRNA